MKSMTIIFVITLLALGGLVFGIKYTKMEEAKALQLESEARLKIEKTHAKKAADERLAKEAESRKAAADLKKAEMEKGKAESERLKEIENVKLQEAKNAEKMLEIDRQKRAKEAADAESKKNRTEKERLDSERKADEEKRKLREVELKREEAQRLKAEAVLRTKLADENIVKDAVKKAELEAKKAEMELEKVRSERLLMYRRAEVSRAELLELEKAEKALAREEMIKNGILPSDSPFRANFSDTQEENVEDKQVTEEISVEEEYRKLEEKAATNSVEKVVKKPFYLDEQLKKIENDLKGVEGESQIKLRNYYRRICDTLIQKAEKEGRTADAEKYKRVRWSLLSDPMSVPPDQGRKFE
ncbi:MAG: hypothetical protein J6V88_03100 [Kiritimatiellae bacterium]|nr:hypothetical protein [Kiritimatiellia bacterium]